MHRVILVRPKFSSNVGMSARVMKNFGFSDLAFVGSAGKKNTFAAKMYAKHSEEILRQSKTFSTLEEAAGGFDILVGTTGVLNRFGKSLKTCFYLDELVQKIGNKKVAIAFGGEGVGLSKKDINACDWILHIPTADAHPIMNLSHAVAVVLYAVSGSKNKKDAPLYAPAPLSTRKTLEEKFANLIEDTERVRDKKKVALAFHRLLSRSLPSEDEAQALMAALAGFETKFTKLKTKKTSSTKPCF